MTGFRRALLPLVLFLGLAATAPRAWFFVSTIPESEFTGSRPFGFERASLPSLPFDTQEFRSDVRLIRWGEDCGHRHGPFHLIDPEDRVRLRGAFERGRRTGEWRGIDAEGNVVLRGHYLDDRRDGPWLEPLGSRSAEVIYEEGRLLRWRLTIGAGPIPWATAPRGFEGELSLHAIGRGSPIPGSFLAIGLGQFHTQGGSVDPEWVEEGTWVCLDVEGRLEGFGPMRVGKPTGLWTFFSASGEIERQVRYGRSGVVDGERTDPPWRDVADSFLLPDPALAAPSTPTEEAAPEGDERRG